MDDAAQRHSAPPDDLAERLRRLARGGGTLDVAQFQFVGLEEIRSAYGERWPVQQARIQNVAEGYLRSRMDASDILISAGGGFVMVLGSASGAESEVIAGQLAHGLNEFFLGSAETLPAPRVAASSHSVPVADLAKTLSDVPIVPPERLSEIQQPFSVLDIAWRYQPVWDVKRETLSNWYVSPYLKANQQRVPGYQLEDIAIHAKNFAAIDEAGLHVSEQGIRELLAQDKQALVGVSVHARTLANIDARARVLALLDGLDRRLLRYRVVKIAGVAPGFPRLYLNEIVHLLKCRAGNVVIGARWDEPDMAGLLETRPAALGVALPTAVVGVLASVSSQELMLRLSKEIQRAHAAKVRFFVEGDIPRALAMKLTAAGVDNISSPRIWPATALPDAMLRWPATRLAA